MTPSGVLTANWFVTLAVCAPLLASAPAFAAEPGESAFLPVDAVERCRAAQAGASPLKPPKLGQASAAPSPLSRTPPDYPPHALALDLEGSCIMTFDVRADGLVSAESIVADCTYPTFAEPATRAVERWCFRPADAAHPDGYPGVRLRFRFEMAE